MLKSGYYGLPATNTCFPGLSFSESVSQASGSPTPTALTQDDLASRESASPTRRTGSGIARCFSGPEVFLNGVNGYSLCSPGGPNVDVTSAPCFVDASHCP